MQTATSETESKSRDLSICVHHYTLRTPCPKGQGIVFDHSTTPGQGVFAYALSVQSISGYIRSSYISG